MPLSGDPHRNQLRKYRIELQHHTDHCRMRWFTTTEAITFEQAYRDAVYHLTKFPVHPENIIASITLLDQPICKEHNPQGV